MITPQNFRRLVSPIRADQCLLGCVAENNSTYLGQAVRFVQALRWFGGALASARVRVCVVDDINVTYRRQLESLGADLRVVARFHPRNPFANKLQFFTQMDWDEAAMVMLLDCDTAVVRDPLPLLDMDCFQAKIADVVTVSHEAFQQIFARYDLELPPQSHVSAFEPTSTIPYCNSGVLFIPNHIGHKLISLWRDWNTRLADNLELLGPHARHCNQASLAVALAESGVPFRAVGWELNYPLHLTHLPAPAGFVDCDPIVLHYHDRVDAEGMLLACPYPQAQARVAAFNARLRAECRPP
jgi:hypothetical protein